MLRWPEAEAVREAVRHWARRVMTARPDVQRIGYFGSCARGDWGVGSDLDVVMVVDRSDQPFERRAASWDMGELPVPVDLVIYTQAEWESGRQRQGRFWQTLERECVWVSSRGLPHDKEHTGIH